MKKNAEIIELENLTIADFTLEVDNLPNRVMKSKELSGWLESTFKFKVVHVGFAYRFQNTLEHYKNMGDIEVKKKIARIKYSNNTTENQSLLKK
jgi:hypothetical protein